MSERSAQKFAPIKSLFFVRVPLQGHSQHRCHGSKNSHRLRRVYFLRRGSLSLSLKRGLRSNLGLRPLRIAKNLMSPAWLLNQRHRTVRSVTRMETRAHRSTRLFQACTPASHACSRSKDRLPCGSLCDIAGRSRWTGRPWDTGSGGIRRRRSPCGSPGAGCNRRSWTPSSPGRRRLR